MKTIVLVTIAMFANPVAEKGGFNRCDTITKQMLAAQADFGESPAFMSQTMSGGVLIFTTNPKTSTWTMWVIPADAPDKLCLFDGGSNWAPASDRVKSIAPVGKPL